MKTFQHISKDVQDRMVANFLESIGNLAALSLADLDELADALMVIGLRIRAESPGQGLLMLAKIIMDHAARPN